VYCVWLESSPSSKDHDLPHSRYLFTKRRDEEGEAEEESKATHRHEYNNSYHSHHLQEK
jgi:hypothetical protein